MKKRTFDQQILEAIVSHLENEDQICKVDNEEGLVDTVFGIQDQINTFAVRFIVKPKGFLILTQYPVAADSHDEQLLDRVTLFLMRVNENLPLGNFYLSRNTGTIFHRSECCCSGIGAPPEELIKTHINCSIANCIGFGPGILDMLYRSASPAAAAEKYKGQLQNRLATVLTAQGDEDEEEAAVSVDQELLAVLEKLAKEHQEEQEEQYLCREEEDMFALDAFIEENFNEEEQL